MEASDEERGEDPNEIMLVVEWIMRVDTARRVV